MRASLSKCFEFNVSVNDESKTEDAFFFLPALRGICEDLIVLNYLKSLKPNVREELVELLCMHGAFSGMLIQREFFRSVRPQQSVLCPSNATTEKRKLEDEIRTIWNRNGWPNMNRGVLPPTQQIAQKQGVAILGILYEYLFRLTSRTVHFSVGSLMRSGWGSEARQFTFSPRNFNSYSVAYAQFYGSFLFCIYFELFGRFLRPNLEVKNHVNELRKNLFYESRWPEMVTFEEMNVVPPEFKLSRIFASGMQARTIKRLIDVGR